MLNCRRRKRIIRFRKKRREKVDGKETDHSSKPGNNTWSFHYQNYGSTTCLGYFGLLPSHIKPVRATRSSFLFSCFSLRPTWHLLFEFVSSREAQRTVSSIVLNYPLVTTSSKKTAPSTSNALLFCCPSNKTATEDHVSASYWSRTLLSISLLSQCGEEGLELDIQSSTTDSSIVAKPS